MEENLIKSIKYLEKQKKILLSQNIPLNGNKEYSDYIINKIKKLDEEILYYNNKVKEIKKSKYIKKYH